ncbi:uncharacterized protein At4g15970 [Brachypodium distachyon]|uniref:Nucleotide-diphospho-sugar transferase domain-containing protein n=1 Tax=Brachypodium distachyon TaxID=15368 RepID=I1GKW6_BRADI|nr:uncharacterized protein At4g15970 [Brachypodium distachyon]KQK12126.1 hypothetical protein BRADI_1g01760v3 [Brachypodium distachyon]|eukprot:XP_003559148.1 uncharacterized protein At4g15970 [Brachypodium distachyon]
MGKVLVAEATARQAASFVLGCAAALTLVLLLQYRPPPSRAPGQFSGSWGAGRRNRTTARLAHHHQAPIAGSDHNHVDDQPSNATSSKAATAIDCARAAQSDATVRSRDHQDEGGEFQGLAAAVRGAATDDKTVIITCVNHAFAKPNSLLSLFLESFRIGDGTPQLLPHLLIVAMDPAALALCSAVHEHCYLYTMPNLNFTSEKLFLSKDYLELVWSKLKLQRKILELGYSFLFTDVDVMWFRDPFKHVTAYADMTVSSDVFLGDPDNIGNFPNTGFFHVKPNNRTIAMTKVWHESRGKYPGANEQPVFNMIKKNLVKELGLKVRYLDTAYIGGFCGYGKDLGKICTMHANCCVGLNAKLRDLRSVLDDWRNYTRLPHWEKHKAKWTVPGACFH